MAVEKPFFAVGRVLYAQALMAMIVTSGFLLAGGWKSALSPLVGGIVAIVPNFYFAYRIYLARHSEPGVIVKAFYSGEAVKLLLTAALFSIALQMLSMNFLTLLIGYVATLSVFWFALYRLRN
ncbi:MAG: F0F1 ATP synthase assembly protein I [Methylomonas sp.]|nr:MAG: F0F1 ATP synthase assembly protein I [Methylomonas sp.]PPD26998.1 MAG: F0F1 ATP synthase assembly protein I [Methylomonas sp.]PPD38937.1 MAG: F0F1 ATP synthase assembly protein I [Methylomonas sp.]PPD42579.1 MAG: F0F1 ATP synthase assembly protein I [Methylomonas sp.]PPD54149.1 MAG: F0F1 ATP synthase assembly protein I [Methylomonas sp.]